MRGYFRYVWSLIFPQYTSNVRQFSSKFAYTTNAETQAGHFKLISSSVFHQRAIATNIHLYLLEKKISRLNRFIQSTKLLHLFWLAWNPFKIKISLILILNNINQTILINFNISWNVRNKNILPASVFKFLRIFRKQ